MEKNMITTLTSNFEMHTQQTDTAVEYWLARDLQHLLGYNDWRNFISVISKAKTACEVSGHDNLDHFVDVSKMVELGSGSQREIDDIKEEGVRTRQLTINHTGRCQAGFMGVHGSAEEGSVHRDDWVDEGSLG